MKTADLLRIIHTANYVYTEGEITFEELEKRLSNGINQYASQKPDQEPEITEDEILNILVEFTHDSPGARRAAKAIIKKLKG